MIPDSSSDKSKSSFDWKNYKPPKRSLRCGGILMTPSVTDPTCGFCQRKQICIEHPPTHVVTVLNRDELNKGKIKWGLPKGHIKPSETIKDCAMREIHEETGLHVDISENTPKIKLNDTWYFLLLISGKQKFHIFDIREIAEVRWQWIEQLHLLSTNRGLKKFVGTFHRIQDIMRESARTSSRTSVIETSLEAC